MSARRYHATHALYTHTLFVSFLCPSTQIIQRFSIKVNAIDIPEIAAELHLVGKRSVMQAVFQSYWPSVTLSECIDKKITFHSEADHPRAGYRDTQGQIQREGGVLWIWTNPPPAQRQRCSEKKNNLMPFIRDYAKTF